MDKLDKIGIEKVTGELETRGLSRDEINRLLPFLSMKGSSSDLISELRGLLAGSETGIRGLDELEILFSLAGELEIGCPVEFDLTLARGLNYYTGAIIEVKSADMEIGSICGGGRYDNLTGIFGLPDISGVGISFGADRIYDVMNELDAFPKEVNATTKVLLINFGEEEQKYCLQLLKLLRKERIRAELYPDSAKLKKQMDYANTRNIPFVILAGAEEIDKSLYKLKNMATGEQSLLSAQEIISIIR